MGFGTVIEGLVFSQTDSSGLVVAEALYDVVEGTLGKVQTHDLGWFDRRIVPGAVSAERQPGLGNVHGRHGGGGTMRREKSLGRGRGKTVSECRGFRNWGGCLEVRNKDGQQRGSCRSVANRMIRRVQTLHQIKHERTETRVEGRLQEQRQTELDHQRPWQKGWGSEKQIRDSGSKESDGEKREKKWESLEKGRE